MHCYFGRSDALNIDTINLMDLCDQQFNQGFIGKFNDEFVDGTTGTAFEDVDTSHVTTNCANTTGKRAERAGAVRHPHSKDKGLSHDANLQNEDEHRVSP